MGGSPFSLERAPSVVEDAAVVQGKSAESDHDSDQLIQPNRFVVYSDVDCGKNENSRVVRVIELYAIPIEYADGCVQTEGGKG